MKRMRLHLRPRLLLLQQQQHHRLQKSLEKRDLLGLADEDPTIHRQIQTPHPHHDEAIAVTNESRNDDGKTCTTRMTSTTRRAGSGTILTRVAMGTSLKATNPTGGAKTHTMITIEETGLAMTEIEEMIDMTICSDKRTPVEIRVTMIGIAETAMTMIAMVTVAGVTDEQWVRTSPNGRERR